MTFFATPTRRNPLERWSLWIISNMQIDIKMASWWKRCDSFVLTPTLIYRSCFGLSTYGGVVLRRLVVWSIWWGWARSSVVSRTTFLTWKPRRNWNRRYWRREVSFGWRRWKRERTSIPEKALSIILFMRLCCSRVESFDSSRL